MKLHNLRDVIEVAERGSLRAAARHLGIAQPALTRSIRELERELGAALFERRTTGVVVTPVGERFIRRAVAAQSELRRAREEVAQLVGQAHGSLHICLSTVAHIALLPEALGPFRRRFPDIRLDLAEGVFPSIEASLRDGSLDFYIGPPPAATGSAGLVVEHLFDNSRVIVARFDHPLKGARRLADLVQAEWITTSITTRAEDELAPLFAQNGLPPPRLVMQTHSALGFIAALTSSDLLMMLPVQWMRFPLTRDALVSIDVTEPLPAPPICVVHRAGLPLTPAGEFFCDLIRRAAAPYQRAAAKAPPGREARRATSPAPRPKAP